MTYPKFLDRGRTVLITIGLTLPRVRMTKFTYFQEYLYLIVKYR
jgi:hypothetical protein